MIYPLTHILLAVLLALLLLWRRWRRAAMAVLSVGALWLYICSTGWFADLLMGSLEDHYRPKALSVVPKAQAIVLLGGAIRGDAHWSSMGDLNQQADRLLHAVSLYKAGKAPVLLLSGGAAPGNRSEAEIMEQMLVTMGVPARAILRESNSRDTHDNAVFSKVILAGKGIERIHLVTSAFHMRRSVALFERQGLEVIPAPTDFQRLVGGSTLPGWLPSVDALSRTSIAMHEYVGYWVYRYRGWI